METNVKKNAAMLTLLMLVKKLLSIVYKIPYQNVTGDAGFYVFQQVYSFIAILLILTGFALPTVIGSLLNENNYSTTIKDKLKRKMWIFALVVFIILFLGNRQIALIMGDILLAPVIRIVGIHFLFLPPIAYMRGVLQSRPDTIKKFGYSVVVEQIGRVVAVLVVLSLFEDYNHSYYQIAELAFIFSLISSVITIMHLYLMKPVDNAQSFLIPRERLQFFRRTMYLLLGSGILVVFGLIDSFLVFNVLVATETQMEAMVLRGVLERGLPLVQAGTFFVGSLVSFTMSQFEKCENDKQKRIAFSTGLFYILGLAIPATLGLMMVIPHLNIALFMDEAGNFTLQIMMIQIVLYSVVVLLTATLSREKKQSFVLSSLLIGILIKLIITVPLVQQFSINGAAISSIASLLVMCLIMLIGSKYLFTSKLFAIFIGISISTFSMWYGLHQIESFLEFLNTGERSGYLYLVLANTGIGIVIYSLTMFTLVSIFKAIGKIILLRHKKRQERLKRAARAKERRQKLQEEQRQEALRLQEEEREQYRQSLMYDQPSQRTNVTVNDYLDGRGHGLSQNLESTKRIKPQTENKSVKITERDGRKMRLDKFLKVSRIIKRRQTAKEVSDAGKISVNGKVAKSSTVLSVGDEIALHYATRTLVVKVIQIKDSTKKEDADQMYEIIREEPRKDSN